MAACGAAELAQALSRPLSCLQGPECGRAARLRALEAIRAEVQERPLSSEAVQEVFEAQLVRPLARCLAGDAAERCRELALQLLLHGLSRCERPGEALPVLLPVLAQRLGPPQGAEPCEELRLGLLQLLGLLLRRGGTAVAPYLSDVVGILQAALLDHFAEVRRESCRCAVACAQAVPGGARGGPRGAVSCGVLGGTRLGPGPAGMQPAAGKRNTLCTPSQERFVSPRGDPVKKKCTGSIHGGTGGWQVGHKPALSLPAQRASHTVDCIKGMASRARE